MVCTCHSPYLPTCFCPMPVPTNRVIQPTRQSMPLLIQGIFESNAGRFTAGTFRSITVWTLPLLLVIMLVACAPGEQGQSQPEATPPPATPTLAEEAPAEETQTGETQAEEVDAAPQPPEGQSESTSSESSAVDGADEAFTFHLVADDSEARFIVDEVLMGNNKTVVGVTPDVTGEITVVPSNPSASQIGTITINARDFKTDSSRRNRAIQRQVLITARDEYQFITFTPTSLEGMPETIGVGDTVSFTVVGDVTILDTTRSETFDMNVTVVSEQELTGLASTTVLYDDYGISIPKVPIVASVEDEVRLELEFTARAE